MTRRRSAWIALGVALTLAALFVVLAVVKPSTGESAGPVLKDEPAPRVVTTELNGNPFDLAQHRGEWMVFNFFQSSCLPCKAEHPELVRFAQQQQALGADGAHLYTVVVDDSDENVRNWFADNGGDWPILRDEDGTIGVGFGKTLVPETFVVDPNGRVRVRYIGATTSVELGTIIQRLREGGA